MKIILPPLSISFIEVNLKSPLKVFILSIRITRRWSEVLSDKK